MLTRARCAVVALFLLLASARAAAEPAPIPDATLIKTSEPRLLCKPPAPPTVCIELPPGRFIDERSWQGIDTEHHRLQDALTRSDAENQSLRESAKEWRPAWWMLASATVTGIALGVYFAK